MAALMVLLAGCSASDSTGEAGPTPSTSLFQPRPVISLVVNDWTASALNVAVAEQLIERYLAYPVVPTRMDDTTEIYEGLADGELDAVLEIWPSAMTERDRRFFDDGDVLDLGDLGAVGKVGWFVPSYMIEQDPELATWEGFQSSAAANLFATTGTRPDGRLLGTHEDYEQHDQEIIANLGLPLQVEFSGSEAATVAELEAAYATEEPILLYWWTPTSAVGAYDLVNVSLPEPTSDCLEAAVTGTGEVDCDYPEDVLFKASSPHLAAKAPDVERFLRSLTLTTGEQISLLVAVEVEQMTIDAAATQWIKANEETWRPWLDAATGDGEGGDGDDGVTGERTGDGAEEDGVSDEGDDDGAEEDGGATEGEGEVGG
jgi:glycine betaine/proline transport system substrate-binding protein